MSETEELFNELIREDELLNHERVMVVIRYNVTGSRAAYWLTRMSTPFFSITVDPRRAYSFPTYTAPRSLEGVVKLVDTDDTHTIEDYMIVSIGERG